MKFFLFSALFLSSPSFAQKAKLLVIDPKVDAKSMEKEFVVEKPVQKNSLPKLKDRDLLLKDFTAAASWDELQKDIFYMDLKNKSLPVLTKKYPKIEAKMLATLKKKIK